LIVFDLVDMDLFRDAELKVKIGEVNRDGITLNDKKICTYGYSLERLQKMSLYARLKNGKRAANRLCRKYDEKTRDNFLPDFLEHGNRANHKIYTATENVDMIDGYFVLNIFASEVKGNVAKVESKEHGTFYFDLNTFKDFRLRVAPPMAEFMKK